MSILMICAQIHEPHGLHNSPTRAQGLKVHPFFI
jgi:hypothetical protein